MNSITPGRGRNMVAARRGLWTRLSAKPFHRILDRIDAGLEVGAIEAMLPDGTFPSLAVARPARTPR